MVLRVAPVAAFAAAAALALFACSSGDNAATVGETQPNIGAGTGAKGSDANGLPCEVQKVLASHCQSCHSAQPQYGAPMPLMTLADLRAPAVSDASKAVYTLVKARTHDAARTMPPKPNAALEAADLATLDAWIDGGAATGAACSAGSSSGGPSIGTQKLACTPDVTLKAKTAFAMPQAAGDHYVCVGVDTGVLQKRHITGIQTKIDNTIIVHHMLLLQSDTPGPATPTDCSSTDLAGGRLVYAWAAGGNALELPPEAGLPIDASSHYTIQFHYNNSRALANQTDQSAIELCTTDQLRANEADVVAFGSVRFTIPPRTTAKIDCDYKLPTQAKEITVFGAMPHMHSLGTKMSTTAQTGTAAPRSLGGTDTWDFNTQVWSGLKETVTSGDNIHTSCSWKNNGDTSVGFGETTADEMCFSFTMYYPKISNLLSWAQPSALAKCTSAVTPN